MSLQDPLSEQFTLMVAPSRASPISTTMNTTQLFLPSCRAVPPRLGPSISYFHHNFVCALLNDLFGVQARAGCQCAGPYAINLLGLVDGSLPKFAKQITDDVGIIKPGFCRLSLTFFMSNAEASEVGFSVDFQHKPVVGEIVLYIVNAAALLHPIQYNYSVCWRLSVSDLYTTY